MWSWSRRRILAGAAGVAVTMLAAAAAAEPPSTTLKFIPQADLRVLDPVWTTATITRNHGYMVYDTLFARDRDFKLQPQMVDSWSVSEDRLTYAFTLREGLRFHDGQPVRAADCVASLGRWSKRDVLGQKLAEAIASYEVIDDRTFAIALKRPFPLLLDALGKISGNVPFIMPERLARTDANTQVTDPTGSGPFKFVKAEWVPGSKAVYVRNPDYKPRAEPASWGAGGKVVRVARVEWTYIPDPATAAAALTAGEVDWWEFPTHDLLPQLERSAAIKVAPFGPIARQAILRFNQLQPPFDNPKMRRALLYAVDQREYMTAVAGESKHWRGCFSFFACDRGMASEAGAEALMGPRDLEKAKRLIKEAGYKNERIVILAPTDFPTINAQAVMTDDLLRRLGLNVELQASDWGTLVTRRASKEPVDKGGWSIIHTNFPGEDMIDPAINVPLRANGSGAWFGWPSDDRIEALRDEWLQAADAAEQKRIAAEIQKEAFESVPYIPVGEFFFYTAFRKNLEGVSLAPALFMWNVEKKAAMPGGGR